MFSHCIVTEQQFFLNYFEKNTFFVFFPEKRKSSRNVTFQCKRKQNHQNKPKGTKTLMVWWYFYHLSSPSHSWRKWLYFALNLLNIIQSLCTLSDISSFNATFNLCLISFLLLVTKTKVHQKHISNSFSFSKRGFCYSHSTQRREKQNKTITSLLSQTENELSKQKKRFHQHSLLYRLIASEVFLKLARFLIITLNNRNPCC